MFGISSMIQVPRGSTTAARAYQTDQQGLEIHHVHQKIALQAISLGQYEDGYGASKGNHAWYFSVQGSDPRGCWSGEIPTSLYKKLNGRKKSLPAVEYLAMSTNYKVYDSYEIWFVRFVIGTCAWGSEVPNELQALLQRGDVKARSVFFGPHSSWLLLLENGAYYDSGNLPGELSRICAEANASHGGVRSLAMGPDGEYFVIANDSAFWRNSLHPSLDRALDALGTDKMPPSAGWIERVRLGPHGSYIAMFEKYTMWRAGAELSKNLWL